MLTSLGTEFRIAEVLAVHLENRTGSLAKVLEKLAEEHINVEYAYASTTTDSRQGSGNLPHVEPQASLADFERGRELGFGFRSFGGADVRCTRGDGAEWTHTRSSDTAADLRPRRTLNREEEESAGRPPKESADPHPVQRPDATIP